MSKYTNIDEYIANYPSDTQIILEKIRAMAHEHASNEMTEAISYGIPTIKIRGKNALHFGAYPHHVAIYPASDEMIVAIPEIAAYRTGKGTLQFKLDENIPYQLMDRIVSYLIKARS